jgi:hypothetical protein
MQPGEIFLTQFPFGDVAGMKLRPVLQLTGQIRIVGASPNVTVLSIVPLCGNARLQVEYKYEFSMPGK